MKFLEKYQHFPHDHKAINEILLWEDDWLDRMKRLLLNLFFFEFFKLQTSSNPKLVIQNGSHDLWSSESFREWIVQQIKLLREVKQRRGPFSKGYLNTGFLWQMKKKYHSFWKFEEMLSNEQSESYIYDPIGDKRFVLEIQFRYVLGRLILAVELISYGISRGYCYKYNANYKCFEGEFETVEGIEKILDGICEKNIISFYDKNNELNYPIMLNYPVHSKYEKEKEPHHPSIPIYTPRRPLDDYNVENEYINHITSLLIRSLLYVASTESFVNSLDYKRVHDSTEEYIRKILSIMSICVSSKKVMQAVTKLIEKNKERLSNLKNESAFVMFKLLLRPKMLGYKSMTDEATQGIMGTCIREFDIDNTDYETDMMKIIMMVSEENFLDYLNQRMTSNYLNLCRNKLPHTYNLLKDLRADEEKWKTDLSADLGDLGF